MSKVIDAEILEEGAVKRKPCENHGLSGHKLYKVWGSMKKRCNSRCNDKNIYYKGKGISVCEEWSNSFFSFYEWSMTNGYSDSLTIDRKNSDGDYEPLNCRWATKSVQSRNTKKLFINNTSGYRGVYKNGKKFAVRIRGNMGRVYLGVFDYAWTAGLIYDSYVIMHNLEHTRNYKEVV